MKISQSLIKQARQLANTCPELVAIEMLKEAGVDEQTARLELAQKELEKSAASSLQARGIDFDEAVKLVKVAGVKVQDLPGFEITPLPIEASIEVLTKAASDAQELEAQNEALMEKIAQLELELEQARAQAQIAPEISGHRTKLASTGLFSEDELESLMHLEPETLSKVASFKEAPVRMGGPSGNTDASDMNPLMQFILG